MRISTAIVEDGCWRARLALEPILLGKIEAEIPPLDESASTLQHWARWWRVRRELHRRLQTAAPPDACY